jgi:hypothetical protein
MSWWPIWRLDHRLQRLIEEADANPKDAAKLSALLHELNKSRCVALILIEWLCMDCVVV